ncbi:hypothetical protein BC829DRAFT_270754 [Chytridium lagenaria]|nr:hypothetical protein BC829DRAFT_270754 [Chytridium lagenaria]
MITRTLSHAPPVLHGRDPSHPTTSAPPHFIHHVHHHHHHHHHHGEVTEKMDGVRKDRRLRQGRLLLVSLLENFCMLYDQSPERNRRLFFVLCKQLSAMGILISCFLVLFGSLIPRFIDEVSAIRGSYKPAFRDLVVQAMQAIQEEQQLAYKTSPPLPSSVPLPSDSLPPAPSDTETPLFRTVDAEEGKRGRVEWGDCEEMYV